MVIGNVIVQVDVENAFTKTAEGAGVGTTEPEIKLEVTLR